MTNQIVPVQYYNALDGIVITFEPYGDNMLGYHAYKQYLYNNFK